MNLKNTDTDPFEVVSSFSKAWLSWARNTQELTTMVLELGRKIQDTTTDEFNRILSADNHSDKESKAAVIDFVKENSKAARKYYSQYSRWLRDFIEKAPGLDKKEKEKSLFWINQIISSLAPSNYFWMNPGAVQRFFETDGESIKKGFEQWLEDLFRGDSLIRLTNDAAFKPGENLAATPGSVVFRNELTELIQYKPSTESAYPEPIVLIQPWINKYYIFDLSEHNSFVRYLVSQGFSVFIISWKNPTSEMRNITFDDYMLKGALAAIETAREICQADKVHAAGYCIGGTVLTALMAWLNNKYKNKDEIPVADWTLFAGLADFSEPGDLGVFIGERSIEYLEKLMEKDGYLDGQFLGLTFRLLKQDSLVWRPFVNNYLYGESPPESDMLYWNSDSTRLPQAMCSFYLREICFKNRLVKKNGVILGDQPIDIRCVDQPLYAVGALQDHISPWKCTFSTCNLVKGPVRYILANDGHITGIVNVPSPRSKKKFWAGNVTSLSDPEEWLAAQEVQRGSWWEDWIRWLSGQSGSPGKPPLMGSEANPVIQEAPGTYVLEHYRFLDK